MVLSLRTWTFRLVAAGVATLLAVSTLGWSAARAATSLTDEVTVVMVVPAGGTQDATTLQQVVDTVNGPVADYWNRQSGGAIRLGVTHQVDWFQATVDCMRPASLFAEAAQRAGWVRDNGKDLLLYLPISTAGCAGVYAPYGTYLHGPGELYVSTSSVSAIAYAFGRIEGFPKADALQCSGPIDAGTCTQYPDGDYYDVMSGGSSNLGSLSVLAAAQQGLIPAGQQRTVAGSDAPTTITLSPVSGTAGIRAIRLNGPNGRVYWLEYRPATGQDAWLNSAGDSWGLEPGVLIRMTTNAHPSLLLYGTPSEAPPPIGTPVQLDDGYFTVTVTAEGADATIQVVPNSPITAAHAAAGGDTGPLGTPTAAEMCTAPEYPWGHYCSRTYQHGATYWSTSTGAHSIIEPILSAWLAKGGRSGPFGLPVEDTVCGLTDGDCKQQFERGTMLWTAADNRRPLGNLESVTALGSTVTVGGWAFDPDAPTSAGQVHVYVDGIGRAVRADGARPDVTTAFPSATGGHGFSWSGDVAPGGHTVCVYAIDYELASVNTPLGCRQVSVGMTRPLGNFELASVANGTLTVAGWAFDPDSPTGPANVHVYVDGQGRAIAADGARSDIGAVFPQAGGAHGFSWSGAISTGSHSVCVYAIDNEFPWLNTPLGCRQVSAGLARPRANWEAASVSNMTLGVSGWAFDPDSASSPTDVHVYIDGRGTAVRADGSRPDVGSAFPQAGAAHGFSWSAVLTPGTHSVCLYAIDHELPGNTFLGCRQVTAGLSVPWGNWEGLTASGTTISVAGWAFDPDSTGSPIAVHVYVDGVGAAITANDTRLDVAAAYPAAGSDHGFHWSGSFSAGRHTVCVYAIDGQLPSRNLPLGCRSVTVG